jgi:hypothetical protein
MPLMIVTDEEFVDEKSRYEKPTNNEIKRTVIEHGRGNTKEVPQVIREIVADCAINGEDVKAVSESFKVSPSSISAYKHGATSTSSYDQNHRVKTRDRIADKAQHKVLEALNCLTEEKIGNSKATEISSIAKDMASVFEKLSGKVVDNQNDGPQVHLHLYGPKQKTLDHYEVIDLNEKVG